MLQRLRLSSWHFSLRVLWTIFWAVRITLTRPAVVRRSTVLPGMRPWSPRIIGYGTPRMEPSIGVSMGTQGYLWTLMFCFGFVGLALFALFMMCTVASGARKTKDSFPR